MTGEHMRAALLIVIIIAAAIAMALFQRDNTRAVDALAKSGKRGDCVRQVVADADENFRHDVRDLILAGRDPVKLKVVVDRMKSRPNYADTVIQLCGSAPR